MQAVAKDSCVEWIAILGEDVYCIPDKRGMKIHRTRFDSMDVITYIKGRAPELASPSFIVRVNHI